MKGKRVIAISVTVILLLLSLTSGLSALDVSVTADAEVAMNPMQMSLFKLSAHRKGMDVYETARAILRQVGYPESIIQVMPEDKLLQVADSRRIETKEEYVCISPDGEAVSASKAQYEAERNVSEGISVLTTKPSTPTENSWAKLQTWVMQDNTNRISYSYSATCTWLKNPVWRLSDHIAIGATEGSIRADSAVAILTYRQTDNDTKKTTDEYEVKSGQNEIEAPGVTVNTYFNLPNDIIWQDSLGKVWGNTYDSFSMMIWVNGTMADNTSMNVCSAYFHQILVAKPDATVSVDGAGASLSFSIFPSTSFQRIINSVEWIV